MSRRRFITAGDFVFALFCTISGQKSGPGQISVHKSKFANGTKLCETKPTGLQHQRHTGARRGRASRVRCSSATTNGPSLCTQGEPRVRKGGLVAATGGLGRPVRMEIRARDTSGRVVDEHHTSSGSRKPILKRLSKTNDRSLSSLQASLSDFTQITPN